MAKNKATKVASRKHLARLERERRQTVAITYTAIALIVIVAGLIVYGILSQTVLLARQPIVKLGDQVVTTREFQARVRVRRQQLINTYFQYMQLAQMFGIDPSTDPSFAQQFSSITGELDNPLQLGQNVVDEVTENLLVRRYAAEHNITVAKKDIDTALYGALGYYPDGSPTPTLVPTDVVYPTLSLTQLALVPPTATQTPVPTLEPTFTPTLDLTSTPTVIPTLTPVPTATLVPTITSTPSITPSPTPYTLEGFQTQFDSIFPTYKKLGLNMADFRRLFFEDNMLRTKVYDAITADIQPVEEKVWARHILVADETTAKTVRTLLLAGGDFAKLASVYSIDPGSKDNGGDYSWFGKGVMVAEFETAAFSLPIGQISEPVKTTHGWHIIQVIGHENRALTADELTKARDAKYQEWLTNAKTEATDLEVFNYWMTRVPTDPTIESVQADGATAQAKTQAALPTNTPEPATPKP